MDGPTPFNHRMREAREAADMTLTDVIVEARKDLPEVLWFSQAKLQRLETSTPENKAEPFMIQWLATLYGVRTRDLSKVAADAFDWVRDDLGGRDAWLGVP